MYQLQLLLHLGSCLTTRSSELGLARFGFKNWSRDGKYLYAEDYSDKTDDLVRVNVADGKLEHLFSLKDVPRGFDPSEFWIGLGSDDSVLLMLG